MRIKDICPLFGCYAAVLNHQFVESKNKLKNFFNSEHEPHEYISKYEENKNFFNDLLNSDKREDLEYVMPIVIYKYADQLNLMGYYTKSLNVLSKIEPHIIKLRGKSKWYNHYVEAIGFIRGVCLGRLKKYNESNSEFKHLIKVNPKNDNFIDWYKGNKKKQIERVSNYILIIIGICYLTFFILELLGYESGKISISSILLVVGVLVLIIVSIWKKVIEKQSIKFN